MNLVLNGPSSSGKSTLARVLQTRLGGDYAIIALDDFLSMDAGQPIYEDDVFEVCPAMAARAEELQEAGKSLIVDHVITSPRIAESLRACLGNDQLWVKITCPLAELERREAARGDRCPGSAKASMEYLYPKDDYDLTVDTGHPTEECVRRILRAMGQ